MPKRPLTPEEQDARLMIGGPGNPAGADEPDELPDLDEPEVDEPEVEEGAEQAPNPEDAAPWKAELATMQAQIEALTAQNQQLQASAQQRPAAVQPQPPTSQSVDFNELLFRDPNEALRIHGEQVAKQVSEKLYAEFRAFDGRREFWRGFYEKFPDLKNAKDLADLTLKSNLGSLGSLPVDQAMDKLAGLTRGRLQSYVPKKSGKRATVEGAGMPLPRAVRVEEERVPTLSDIIRGNRAARRGKAKAA
jgi:hypothetical protein